MKDRRDSRGSQLSAAMVNQPMVNQPHVPRTDSTRPKEEAPEGSPRNNYAATECLKACLAQSISTRSFVSGTSRK